MGLFDNPFGDNGNGLVGGALEGLFGSFTPGAVPPRNLGAEVGNTLGVYRQYAPDVYGLEAQYRPQYAGLERGILTDSVRGMTQGAGAVDPAQASLLGELNRQALSELQMGAQLDPSLRNEVQQSVRAGQAARGLGLGPADVYQEAMQTGSAAQALRSQRRSFAGGVGALNLQNIMPYLGLGQQFTQAKPVMFDQWNPYAADLYNTNYNAEAARQIAAAANRASVAGATLGAAGKIGGAFLGGG